MSGAVLGAAIIGFLLSAGVTRALTEAGGWLEVLDQPNERSLHSRPTPRTGGLGIWAAAVAGAALVSVMEPLPPAPGWIGAGALLIGLVSFGDDRVSLPARARFLVQMGAAVLLLLGGLVPETFVLPMVEVRPGSALAAGFALLFATWMTNLYNFMDGMDGLAGGMALVGFGTFGFLGWQGGSFGYAGLCWAVAGAAGGFLVWNFAPARIFMGDVGSSSLGFVAAGLSLWADVEGLFPLWIGALVFSPFIVDASVTLVRRALKGERVWEAHRTHFYQRLVQAGWGHRKTALWAYGLMGWCALLAVLATHVSVAAQTAIITIAVVVYVAIMVGVVRIARAATRA